MMQFRILSQGNMRHHVLPVRTGAVMFLYDCGFCTVGDNDRQNRRVQDSIPACEQDFHSFSPVLSTGSVDNLALMFNRSQVRRHCTRQVCVLPRLFGRRRKLGGIERVYVTHAASASLLMEAPSRRKTVHSSIAVAPIFL